MGHGDEINVHQPLPASGHILPARQDHHVSFRMRWQGHVFLGFGEVNLGLGITVLKLAQSSEKMAAGKNAVDH